MKRYLGAFALLCLLMMAACTDGGADTNAVKLVDITEIVPIHGSSLEYFDYVITFQDNTGRNEVETISDASSPALDYYRKTYQYDECPVLCTATVELVPKVPETEVVSFTFITPKPYLMCMVFDFSSDGTDNTLPEGYEEIEIQSMEVSEFMSTYGTRFFSHCRVDADQEGVQANCF